MLHSTSWGELPEQLLGGDHPLDPVGALFWEFSGWLSIP
jgi:hypothetical protein